MDISPDAIMVKPSPSHVTAHRGAPGLIVPRGPSVLSAAVFTVPDARLGEAMVAAVALKPGTIGTRRLINWLLDRIKSGHHAFLTQIVHGRAGHAGNVTLESLGHGDTDTEFRARRTTEPRRDVDEDRSARVRSEVISRDGHGTGPIEPAERA